jgi:hypothetical protein
LAGSEASFQQAARCITIGIHGTDTINVIQNGVELSLGEFDNLSDNYAPSKSGKNI